MGSRFVKRVCGVGVLAGLMGAGLGIAGMGQNFVTGEPGQLYLLPPDAWEWSTRHLAARPRRPDPVHSQSLTPTRTRTPRLEPLPRRYTTASSR